MIEREVKAEVWIPLTQGQVTVIDFEDFEKVRPYKWHALRSRKGWRACTTLKKVNGRRHCLYLSRLILPTGSRILADHRDGDELNNRRINLRPATYSQNAQNAKVKPGSLKGVSFRKARAKWVAYLRVNNRQTHLGSFDSKEDAARAYDAAAQIHFGEFAQLNFPGK